MMTYTMKQREYTLKIDNPCQQEWSSMTHNGTGKFCSQCSKTVIDFTKLTDTEIVQIIEQTSGSICGRLQPQQLNRILSVSQPTHHARLHQILAGLLLVGTTGNSSATGRPALPIAIVSADHDTVTRNPATQPQSPETTDKKNWIKGRVLDSETEEPLIGATVAIKGTKTGVVTDVEGKFKLVLPDSLLTDRMALVVAYTGYEQRVISFDKKDIPMTKDFFLASFPTTLIGEVCVVKQRKWWQFWKKR
jgi:CarboxypepD_reg-like domain